MKIKIDSATKTIYEDCGCCLYFYAKFFDKKALISFLREIKPALSVNCRASFHTIQEKFNSL